MMGMGREEGLMCEKMEKGKMEIQDKEAGRERLEKIGDGRREEREGKARRQKK